MKPKPEEKWEKEFDKLTEDHPMELDDAETVENWLSTTKTLYSDSTFPESELELDIDKVRDFIRKTLSSTLQRACERVENMPTLGFTNAGVQPKTDWVVKDDVIKVLKET